jgi:hypothetical protein
MIYGGCVAIKIQFNADSLTLLSFRGDATGVPARILVWNAHVYVCVYQLFWDVVVGLGALASNCV